MRCRNTDNARAIAGYYGISLYVQVVPGKMMNSFQLKKNIYGIVKNALPVIVSTALLFVGVFYVIIPEVEHQLLSKKRESVKNMVHVTTSLLNEYYNRYRSKELTLEQAQSRAIKRISRLRYGPEDKDYFWICDTTQKMVVHPYRTDLNGKDISCFRDSKGTYVFREIVKLATSQNEGFVFYNWQWKDDPLRISPKMSYVKLFEPWGWIIGTGLYIEDIKTDIRSTSTKLLYMFLVIMALVSLLSCYIILNNIRIENRRVEAEKESRSAREKAIKASMAKTEFLARMSHEIRTPLNAIMGMAELLSDTDLSEEQKDFLNTIKESSQHLITIINDILDFSRIEAGKISVQYNPFNIKELISSVVNGFAAQASQKKNSLEIIADEKAPAEIVADPMKIRQVLVNIIDNAMKFTSHGAITVTLESSVPGNVLNNYKDLNLTISIQDTGIGIPQEKIPVIFERFEQADSTFKRQFGGTGLGLAICKQLVEILNGTIEIHSIEGRGTTFTVIIPVQKADDRTAPESHSHDRDPLPEKELSILLAEDNEVNIKMTVSVLRKIGHTVTVARNGFEVLDLLRGKDFDVIVMDIEMPLLDGLEATRKIRHGEPDHDKKNIPIIAMSAHVLTDVYKKCLQAGMDGFIAKPINIKTINTLILQSIQEREVNLRE